MKRTRQIFELGRKVGLKQSELVVKGKVPRVVCGDNEIIFEMDHKKWILDGPDRYEKILNLLEMA